MSAERQEYSESSPWWGEHVFRYTVLFEYLKDSDKILDLACGNGYGTYLLCHKTKETVIGGDIDAKAIELCKVQFKNENLNYELLNGTKLPFENDSFNIVVSFETIEHTKEYKSMVAEFKRILMPGGLLFISTPNSLVTSPDGVIKNPFHTQEWTPQELKEMLDQFFADVKLYGQSFDRYQKKNGIAFLMEKILYFRGIRKLPLKFQDGIMRLLGKDSIYPQPHEFSLKGYSSGIENCPTLFAICRK